MVAPSRRLGNSPSPSTFTQVLSLMLYCHMSPTSSSHVRPPNTIMMFPLMAAAWP